jgi:hypothetical protein
MKCVKNPNLTLVNNVTKEIFFFNNKNKKKTRFSCSSEYVRLTINPRFSETILDLSKLFPSLKIQNDNPHDILYLQDKFVF